MDLKANVNFERFETALQVVDAHTVGEFCRVVIGGFPEPEGSTMIEKKKWMEENYDHVRTALMFEPRGHHDMFGAFLCKPVNPEADFGVMFLDTGGYLNMCGHCTIGAVTVALEAGLLKCKEGTNQVVLEAPAGLIRTEAVVKDGKVESVTLTNVPSFVYKENCSVVVDGKEIPFTISFGGSFFALVDTTKIGFDSIDPKTVPALTDLGMKMMEIINKEIPVQHPLLDITTVDLGANIFSSVYGVVEEVLEDRIVIRPDAEQKEEFVPIEEGSKLDMVKAAGVVGMGGAGFPTGVKIGTDLNGGYVLVNAAECEPGLRHNMVQLEEQTDITIRGLKYCMEVCNASKGIIAIKKKNEKAVEILRKAIKDEENLTIHLLPDIYPMGEERAVVRECLGILLDPTQLPSAANAVVINCETLLRMAEAIEQRKPCFSKHLTVIGKLNGGNGPHVYLDVPVGTSVGDLIERAGGIEEPYGEIIMGGPFTGKSTTLDAPITKTTGGIIVTIEFPDLHGANVGLLVCACGGSGERMYELADKMNGNVVSIAACKQAVSPKEGAPLKCENPGNCPGQAQKCLQFKKDKAEYIIIGNCSDCSNTVMGSAPKMKLKTFHQTDHVMRTIGHSLYRRLTVSKQVDQLPNGK